MKQKLKNNNGFTLVEILAVIVILGIIIAIGVPSLKNMTEKNRKKAFFTSVTNLVNKINTDSILKSTDYCMYSYNKDEKNQTDSIYSMYVLVHKDSNDKKIYSVYAKSKENEIDIDAYDFSQLDINKSNEWVKKYNDSYSKVIVDLAENPNKISEFKVCEKKTGDK